MGFLVTFERNKWWPLYGWAWVLLVLDARQGPGKIAVAYLVQQLLHLITPALALLTVNWLAADVELQPQRTFSHKPLVATLGSLFSWLLGTCFLRDLTHFFPGGGKGEEKKKKSFSLRRGPGGLLGEMPIFKLGFFNFKFIFFSGFRKGLAPLSWKDMLDHNNYALGAKIYFQRENEGTMAASLISPVICTRIEVIFFYFFFFPWDRRAAEGRSTAPLQQLSLKATASIRAPSASLGCSSSAQPLHLMACS